MAASPSESSASHSAAESPCAEMASSTEELPELPDEFRRRILADFGSEGERLLESLREPPVAGVRMNPRKPGGSPDWLSGAERIAWCREGYYLAERPDFTLTPSLHAGGFYVQEPSSTIHEHIVRELAGDSPVSLLDLCAAPGGKSTAAIAAVADGSVVVSNEVMPARAGILAENLVKWGYPGSIVTSATAAAIGGSGAQFDIILLDAPCSGEGMMRKEAEAIRQWSPGLVESCARLQRSIADDILPALREGGYLVYSTCTFSRSENEENVRHLLEEYPFESVDMGLERFGIYRSDEPGQYSYRFMPHITRGEGLFVSVLRHTGAPNCGSRRTGKLSRAKLPPLPQLLRQQDAYTPITAGERIYMLDNRHTAVYTQLRDAGVRFLNAGVELGTMKRSDLIPAHGLAMSSSLAEDAFPRVELGDRDALLYLRRELASLPADTPRGYVAVHWRGHVLGLLKNLGNRANSLYPTAWKIRKNI